MLFNILVLGIAILILIIINYFIIIKTWRGFIKDQMRRNITYQTKHNASSQEKIDDESQE